MQGGTVALPRANSHVLAIDIGGGSTEVISGLPSQISTAMEHSGGGLCYSNSNLTSAIA